MAFLREPYVSIPGPALMGHVPSAHFPSAEYTDRSLNRLETSCCFSSELFVICYIMARLTLRLRLTWGSQLEGVIRIIEARTRV